MTIALPNQLIKKQDRGGIKQRFDDDHLLRYGTCAPGEPAEIVSLRATVSGVMKAPPLEKIARGSAAPPKSAILGTRMVSFDNRPKPVKTTLYRRGELKAGNRIKGPALIEEHASTTTVFPGDTLVVDQFGNLVITIGGN